MLLLDIGDKGTESISDVEDCDVMDIKVWSDLEDAFWYLNNNNHKYKTIILDTVTGMQGFCIEEVLRIKKKKVQHPGDWGTMTKREWGDVAAMMKEWLLNFRDLECTIVFLAQDRVFNAPDEDEDNMLMPEVGARLAPSVAAHLNAIVSVIGNTFIRSEWKTKKIKKGGKTRIEEKEYFQYCLRIGPNAVYVTKLRKPRDIVAPSFLVDPSYQDLTEIIKGVS